MMAKIKVSIGVMAYNEGQNISHFLESLFGFRKNNLFVIDEVIVISSGSTDQTNSLVKKIAEKYSKIKLIVQKKRLGKAAAVNLFLAKARNKLLVLSAADLILKDETLEHLISPFKDPKVGIVGSHPKPVNLGDSFLGFANQLLWELHHQISLKKPKMGEMIAFRKIFQQIPILSAVDEANIEPLIRGQGYKSVYAPKAWVLNKGPETLAEFISVRRRIFAGHLAARYEYSYEVTTLNSLNILWLLFKNVKLEWRFFIYTPFVILLEGYCRTLGWVDYKSKRDHSVWQVARSAKKLEV